MVHQYCGVFAFKGTLYVNREEGVGGPRRMLWPLKVLPMTIDAESLGAELMAALEDYREGGRPILADEWEVLIRRSLDFFGEKSVGAFERKKKGITVRRDVKSGTIALFRSNGKHLLNLQSSDDPSRLGSVIRENLALPDSDPTQG